MTDLTEIIEACKRGEELARKLLYEEFSMRMRAVCFRYLGNKSDTEDILHECFIIVFTKINQFTGKGSFEGWLKRIFINSSLQFIKEKRKFIVLDRDDLISKWEFDNISNPISAKGVEKQENLIRRMNFTKDELMSFLQLLPDGYRIVFNLFVFEKHSHKEISEILDISGNTSKSQLFKARKFLQQKLYEEGLKRESELENIEYKEILRVVI